MLSHLRSPQFAKIPHLPPACILSASSSLLQLWLGHSICCDALCGKLLVGLEFWGLIYKISYDNLTIMPKLRSTYDRSLIYKTSYMNEKLFVVKNHVLHRNIVGDSVRKLTYERNFSTF